MDSSSNTVATKKGVTDALSNISSQLDQIENEISILTESMKDDGQISKENKAEIKSSIKKMETEKKAFVNQSKQLKAKLRKLEYKETLELSTAKQMSSSLDGFDLSTSPDIAWKKLESLGHVSVPVSQATIEDIVPTMSGEGLGAADDDSAIKKFLRVVCISDTHGKHRQMTDIPEGDVIIHAGDITESGEIEQLEDFAVWFSELPFRHKLCIAGNHDITIQKEFYQSPGIFEYFHKWRGEPIDCDLACTILKENKNFLYLEDSSVEIEGINFYGAPWQPGIGAWGFELERGHSKLQEKWCQIPDNTDVVITHGPPVGHGDYTNKGERVGCVDLLHEIDVRVKPKFHVFGHVHEGAGVTSNNKGTYFINAATCNRSYEPLNPPFVFKIRCPSSS